MATGTGSRSAASGRRQRRAAQRARGEGPARGDRPGSSGSRTSPWLAALAPLLVFFSTLGHGFLLDDHVLFRTSASLSDLGSLARGFRLDLGAVRAGADHVISSYYRPVFLALSTLYYQAVGGSPRAWHAAAVGLAALIAVAAAALLARLGLPQRTAVLAAIVFSLHPSHVSSVAWASGIQELLAALFALLALLALAPPTLATDPASAAKAANPRAGRLALAALAFALALLSKEVAIALPAVVAVWALAIRASEPQRARRLAAATGLLTLVALGYLAIRFAVLGGLAHPSAGAPALRAALASAPVALATYLRLLALPLGFDIFRPERPTHGLTDPAVLAASALLVGLAIAAVLAIRRRRDLALPLAWSVLWLAPVLNLWALEPQWMVTDRYLFLPSLALPWLLALALPKAHRDRALAALAIAFALLSWRYAAIFANERTFVAAMERAEPTSPTVWAEKGRLLLDDGRKDEARAALERAIALDPLAPRPLLSLGDLALERGDFASAERHYRQALVERPYASKGFKLLALAWARAGQVERAVTLIAESVDRWPEDFEVQLLGALLFRAQGDPRAESAHAAATRLRPADPAIQGGLEATYARLEATIAPRTGARSP